MAEFTRPGPGFRFAFGGVNTKDVADALPEGKYQAALNVRATADFSIRTRPGYELLFTANNNQNNFATAAITDLRAYTELNNNAFPRILARDANGRVFLDNGMIAGNLNGNTGYGVSMNPFRPRESALSWMYIAGIGDYQRFAAPSNNNAVVQAKVGIAEPQNAVGAVPQAFGFSPFLAQGAWNNAGNAGAYSSGNRTADTAGGALGIIIADPLRASRYSMAVSNNVAYSVGQELTVNAVETVIQDVLAPITTTVVDAIRYLSGNTGACVIVPRQMPFGEDQIISALRRGALIQIGGTEGAFVEGLVRSPNGKIAFMTTLGNTHSAGEAILGQPAVIIEKGGAAPSGNVTSAALSSNLSAGVGTLTQVLTTNPFNTIFNTAATANQYPQQDDYVHLSVRFSDPSQLIQLLILFSLDPGGNNFNSNLLYYAVRPGDLTQIPSGNQSVISAILDAAETAVISTLPTPGNISPPAQSSAGNNQWSEIMFPISAMTRIGNDEGKSLITVTAVQLQANVANNVTMQWSSLWVGGGGQVDVGNNGMEFRYLCVPMNSTTGVMGNPTPVMRYGVFPRRQPVLVKTSSLNNSYDSQIDTWLVYRQGGSITSYRYIGSVPTGSDFVDNFFDSTAAAGEAVVIDNTEPWPTIDQPWSLTGNAAGVGQYLTANSSVALPSTMNRWLPGTLFQVGSSQDVFTLRSRPVPSNNSVTFEFEESMGNGSQGRVFVLEPNVACQPLPYVWGPDEHGYFFGCGDPYRPGVLSHTKAYAPDAVPTKSNIELCAPSEPLLGGEVIRGVSIVASSKRWWYLNFQAGSERQLFIPVEAAVGKRLAAPYGKTTDGSSLFFWSDDCIAQTDGGPAISLTDDDLYNLFPHGGLNGVDVVSNGVTYYAPDYSRVAQFRLTFRTGMLLAIYLDSSGSRRVLVYDLANKAWSSDEYAHSMSVGYSVEQPRAPFQGNQTLFPGLLLGDTGGRIWKVRDLVNDNNTAISAVVATREYNAGDARTNTYWGDQFLDVIAPAGMNAIPIVEGLPITDANNNNLITVIAANNNRQFVPVSLGGSTLQNFLGMRLTWTDNFSVQTRPTQLNAWQPSYIEKPETITTRWGDTVDFGQASYVRGVTIYADTFAADKVLMIRNMDNGTLMPLQSVAGNNSTINHDGEQEINYWFDPPFVAHMVRDEPQDAVPWRRFKLDYIKDPWPELTDLPSPWMNIRDTGQAGFLQGLILPLEVGDANNTTAPSLKLRVDSSNNLVDLIPHVDPMFNVKTGVAYALSTPVVCHQVQIIPQEPCRVWWNEIAWKAQATPDLGTHWITQWTGFGIKGFKHIPKIEFSYSAQAVVLFYVDVQDGTAPAVISLPATSGEQSKVFANCTFNKGQLFRFRAISDEPFQLFMEDTPIWVCEWGRLGPAVPFKMGAQFGDQAPI